MQKAVRLALFCAVIFLASYLRITGLAWGLESGYGHYRNFQPDEFISLRGVLEIDLLHSHIRVPSAYFEGTFNYYLWAIPKAALKLSGRTEPHSAASTGEEDHASLLYICRWMTLLFDLATIIIVFLVIREATQNFYASFLGACVYAVLPMQVIYAHFMRTHILGNLLCALVIWISLKLRTRQRLWLLLSAGFISGLGAATRYPVGIISVIPCLYLLFDRAGNLPDWRIRIWEGTKHFVAGPIWSIGAGFVIGLFFGHPMLFLDSGTVIKSITDETLKYASLQEFKSDKLLNLYVVWRYVSYLIPFAMYPLLWLIPYCAILYLGFRRSLLSQCLPIMIFSLLYLYFMAKGYLGPYYARATMLLFPGFCVLVGIACNDLRSRLRKQRTITILLVSTFCLVVGSSVVFDLAYVQAMQERDARTVLREDLHTMIGESFATIGVSPYDSYIYTVMPAVDPLKSEKVRIQLQDPEQKADFFLMGLSEQFDSAWLNAIIRRVEKQGAFRYEKTYIVRPKIFGRELQLARFPRDMTYPFPTILLFRG